MDLGNGMVCALLCGQESEHGVRQVLCISILTFTMHDNDGDLNIHAASPPPRQKRFLSVTALRRGAFNMDGYIHEDNSLLDAFICAQDPVAIMNSMFNSTMKLDLDKVPEEWYRRPEEAGSSGGTSGLISGGTSVAEKILLVLWPWFDPNPLCNLDDGIINTLPDSVLCHILSFLPTSTCVRTCILSRRWRHLGKDLQLFNLSCNLDREQGGHEIQEKLHMHFLTLANAVLVQRNPLHIRNLSMEYLPSYLDFNNDAVTGWVRAATGPHLEELRLRLWSGKSEWRFVVPPAMFISCPALVSLNLTGVTVDLTPEASSSIQLPSLKTLRLLLDSPDNVDRILSGCPLLETLHLTIQRFQHCSPKITALKIHVPSLKRLELMDCGDSGIVVFELDTPSVEYLYIRLYLPYYLRFSAFRSLLLERSTGESLLLAPTVHLPDFRNLSNLEIHFKFSISNTRLLFNMLDRCDTLHVLTIYKETEYWPAYSSSWKDLPANVPKCMVSHLSIVKFSSYCGNRGDLELIAYILQNGLVLTSVIIETNFKVDSDEHRQATQQFCDMPKGSNRCNLNVRVRTGKRSSLVPIMPKGEKKY
ncbi:hypothetical protein PIB30_057768 [Stylosanthes scabra]|uniref:F-box domain-containing protein n=1 Tax=Stylosanthes scabra TaxID=79078 RepID=A0ABU6QJG5_9FABA|nr:hypothetical protein [Stylosanthes scabra]